MSNAGGVLHLASMPPRLEINFIFTLEVFLCKNLNVLKFWQVY